MSIFRTGLMILCIPIWVSEGILAHPVPDEANCLGLVFLATIMLLSSLCVCFRTLDGEPYRTRAHGDN
ncbi:hypothetical protein F5Y04DRAFT_247637 [Hypomontagnella monticulosa]|nr:hypothetical protein F5Y04DRAFT_247637 [Hypomontagnella monticulosa]